MGRAGSLLSNTHALYQYCPMPKIMFPELEHELFCNIYYLRHLCDTAKFPTWPVKNPVRPCAQRILLSAAMRLEQA